MNRDFWHDRRVLLTGHTGFKGAWLAAWLESLGALVSGIALPSSPGGVYRQLEPWAHQSVLADLREADLRSLIEPIRPEVVFHLAAQSTVQNGYRDPVGTFATNVMGTVRLLDALRGSEDLSCVVVVTTDKVYGDQPVAFTEADRLIASDPYAGSKVGQEVVVDTYRHSYFEGGTQLVAARAGNVIGGGDDGPNRLLPDCVRAAMAREAVRLRYPSAVRPWQHVVEPLRGYLMYAEAAATGTSTPPALNFGPDPSATATVQAVAEQFLRELTGEPPVIVCEKTDPAMVENPGLSIDASAAAASLGWKPALDVHRAVEWTASWYAAAFARGDLRRLTMEQIAAYEELLG